MLACSLALLAAGIADLIKNTAQAVVVAVFAQVWTCGLLQESYESYTTTGVLTPREIGDGMHRPARDTTNKTYQKTALTHRNFSFCAAFLR